MAAQIILFPKVASVKEEIVHGEYGPMPQTAARRCPSLTALHLVKSRSQQAALRIVEDVCREHDVPHPTYGSLSERSSAFWATLPMPPARVETPVSVAKRLAHVLLPINELA